MRFVIKPAGIFLILIMIGVLSILAFWGKPRKQETVVPITVIGSTNTAAPTKPVLTAATNRKPIPNNPISSSDLVDTTKMNLTTSSDVSTQTTAEEVIPGVQSATTVYTYTLKQTTKNPWDVVAILGANEPLKKGGTYRLVFRARSPEKLPFIANCEQTKEPYAKTLAQTVATTPDWNLYTMPFSVTSDDLAEGAQISFHLGSTTGSIQIADIHLYQEK